MANSSEEKKSARSRNRRDHMANERTFLAWIRTSIGIMAFGFVIEKFAFFLKKLAYFLGQPGMAKEAVSPAVGYSPFFGILLGGLGALMGVLAFIRYKKVEIQIEADSYRPSLILDILLAIGVFATGIFVVIYLMHNI